MSSQPSKYEGKDLVKVLVTRAMTDDGFRKEFLKNPEAVVEKETGQKLPAGLHIKAVEDTADTIHILVPAKASAGRQLGDAQLENVAGGALRPTSIIRGGSTPFSIVSLPGHAVAWGVGGGGGSLFDKGGLINPARQV